MSPYIIPGLVRDFSEYTFQGITEKVSVFFGVPINKIFERTRKRDVVNARYVLIWILRKKMDMKFSEIGRCFEFDHTTVMHAVRSVDDLMKVYPGYRHTVNDLISIITGTKSLYINRREKELAQ